jgi:filamentous hemagglutinin family protein
MKRLFLINLLLLLHTDLAAQIKTDGTLGQIVTLPGPNVTIPADLGQQREGNLFHSFETFNLHTHETATFTGPNTITSILSRVTGGRPSFLDGTLRSAIPNANFYFFNPSGMVFGEHAQLDLAGGAFYASTAAGIKLGPDGDFLTTSPNQHGLTAAPPIAFGFLDSRPATIEVQGNNLAIKNQTFYAPNGQINLTSNGDLHLEDSILYAPAGQINVTATNAFTLSQKALLPPPAVLEMLREDSSAYQPANLDVSGKPGGKISIQADALRLDKGLIFADTCGPADTCEGDGQGIDIRVKGNLDLQDGARITADNYGNGQGGKITIQANAVSLSGRNLELPPREDGLPPNEIDSLSTIATNNIATNNNADGKGGNIEIETPQLNLTPGLIQAATAQAGQAGSISIKAQRILMRGLPELRVPATIDTSSGGTGQAGLITVEATEEVALTEFSDISSTTTGRGAGGEIHLMTPRLTLSRSIIQSVSASSGQAGAISLTANTVSLTAGSHINTEAEQAGGGDITMQVRDQLSVTDHSRITTAAQGREVQQAGGNITISPPRTFILNNGYLLANAVGGKGGTIKIQTDHLVANNGAIIDVSSKERLNGKVWVNNQELNDNFTAAAKSFLDASQQLTCSPRARGRGYIFSHDNVGKVSQTDRDTLVSEFAKLTQPSAQSTWSPQSALAQNTQALQQLNAWPFTEQPVKFAQLYWQRARLLKHLGQLKEATAFYYGVRNALEAIRPQLQAIYQTQGHGRLAFQAVVKPLLSELLDLLLQQQRVEEALPVIERLKTGEVLDYFKDDCVSQPTDINAVDRAHTAIIYPILLDQRLAILVSLPQTKHVQQIVVPVPAVEVHRVASLLREQLACQEETTRTVCTKQEAYRPLAKQLYEWLIKPLAHLLTADIETLVFVPDGPLYTIPMAVLYDGKHFLIEKYAIAVMPSLTLTDPSPLPLNLTQTKVLFNGLTESTRYTPLLPYAETLAREIQTLFPDTTVLKGKNFRPAQLAQTLATSYFPLVILFSHAQFAGKAEDSFISTYDDKLTLEALRELIRPQATPQATPQQPIKLLALGACETVKGDEQAALGMAGIAYQAGAQSVIGTLWQTRSDIVFDTLKQFYPQFQHTPQSKAKVLQQVQIMLLKKQYPPHYWSPFLLIGNWL